MTCGIARPDPKLLFDRYRNMFSANVLGGSPVIPESNEWYVVAMDFAVAEEFYSVAEQQWRELDPRYACCDNLISLAAVDGMFPKAASFAEGYVKFTGTPASASTVAGKIPLGTEMIFGSYSYRTVGYAASAIGADGTTIAHVRAVIPGGDSNLPTGNLAGNLVTPLLGVDKAVTLQGSLCGGVEKEDCEAFRLRYLARKQYQPRATDAWIRQKLLEWPCATRVCKREGACCDPNVSTNCVTCRGTYHYYVMFDNTFECGLPPQCIADEITRWMFGDPNGIGLGQAEIGICGQVHTATGVPINITIDGLNCVTPSQQAAVLDAIKDLFSTLCPSQDLLRRQVELVIAQIVGADQPFEVVMTPTATGVAVSACGDLEVNCDYMPCAGVIKFAYEQSGVCA